jgi:hypothetical protein
MALVAAVIAARFYFAFGTVPPFAWGFIGAVTVFQVLLIVGLRFQDRPDIQPARPLQGDWLDHLGAWWLMACAFGALLGWVSGEAGILLRSPSPLFPLGRILFAIVLPLATMLPNVRYVSRSAAFVQVPLLVGVTLLPILVGLDAIPVLLNGSRP